MSPYGILKFILDIILPQRCLSCRKVGEIICDHCLHRLPKESNIYGITTLFSYSDSVIQRAIWLLKYKGVKEIAKPIARVLHERLLEDLSETKELHLLNGKILLIPVPLSNERQRERGFNQSELIAKEIAKLDEQSFEMGENILKKIRNTRSQVEIKNRAERLKNLQGAFALENINAVRGRTILLLDDVTTTGTTLNECAKTLKKARPRHIIKVAIAH